MNIKYYYHSPRLPFLSLFPNIAVLGDSVNSARGFASGCYCGKGLFHFINNLLSGLFEIGPSYTIKGRFPNQSILE